MQNNTNLIVALDFPDIDSARKLVKTCGDTVSFYKVGLELTLGGGLDYISELKDQNKQVFLDLKFHDIGNTVENAVRRACALGVDLLTVHAYAQTMQAAKQGRENSKTKILGVTVLTSWQQQDLDSANIAGELSEVVLSKVKQAQTIGIDGVVASAQEAQNIRANTNPINPFLIVTPGIRMAEDALGDQQRITTPQDAIAAGADYLVVGRPITKNADPKQAAEKILENMRAVNG